MARALIVVLDSVGIGGAPDAAAFGDEGADTLGHVAEWCARNRASGPLKLPNLDRLGLGRASALANGATPPGLDSHGKPDGLWGAATEVSSGKDTPSGHWEIAGVPVREAWGYFPDEEPSFPTELTDALIEEADLPGILGNRHAPGTAIVDLLGEEHQRTGKPICYTSADSVLQIAAHEESFGLERLYEVCEVAFRLVKPYRIGRVIARPFVGEASGYERTANRRDYAVEPPAPTIIDRVAAAGGETWAVGKIRDIFAGRGVTHVLKGKDDAALVERTSEALEKAGRGDLVFANLVEFDTLYGHRRDPEGYAAALETFDARLSEIRAKLLRDDLAVVTADHGNDPTWRGTDHTRERVPVLAFGPRIAPGELGIRETYADIGATVAAHLGLGPSQHGESFLGGRSVPSQG